MPQMITEPITKDGFTLNIALSTSMVCLSLSLFFHTRLIRIMTNATVKKVIVIRSRKG